MTKEYNGDDFLFAVVIPDEAGGTETTARVFNQTDGGRTIEADSVDLSTKDKTGSSYGAVTESVSLEGVLTQDDPAIPFIENAIRGRRFIEILKINSRTLDAERGSYMLSNFEDTYSNGEFANYSLEASLNGSVTKETLTEVPEGAPE
jgi:TP901-1 family phage major tail protein